jgi:hypothetical protein
MQVKVANLFLTQTVFLSILSLPPALAETACIKSPAGKVICGELVPKQESPNTAPSSQTMVFKTKSGLDFTLNGCSKSRDGLSCSISIYNSTDFDKKVGYNTYYTYSIIDSEGNEYKATRDSSIGNKSWGGTILPPKLKIRSQLFFKPNGPLSDFVRVLKFNPSVDNRTLEVTFRDFRIN